MHLKDYAQYARDRAVASLRERTSVFPRPDPRTFLVRNVEHVLPGIDRARLPGLDRRRGRTRREDPSPQRGSGAPGRDHSDGPRGHADALAYYLPFHFYVNGAWGIYVLESGIVGLAREIAGGAWDPRAAEAAFEALVEHEMHHCVAEVGMTRIEVMVAGPVYPAWFAHPQAAWFEEAMANARASRAVRRMAARFSPLLDAWMRRCGPGYRDFPRFLAKGDFLAGQQQSGMLGLSLAAMGPADGPVHHLLDPATTPRRPEVPIFLVLDQRAGEPRLPDHLRQEFAGRVTRVLTFG